MRESREMLEEQLKNYEGQLKRYTSYLKELKDKIAEYDTPSEQVEEDLREAEYNIEYYEGEAARVRELIGKGTGGATQAAHSGTYVVYKDSSGEWRWQLLAANKRIIADSGEGYKNKQDCLHAIALVKDSKDAPVEERP